MPKVSIIMPIYNKEKYLKAALDSVLNQTWTDWELIAVNDGSTDESLSILKEYQSNNPKIRIINQRNRGVSAARNAGLTVANGKWIQFLDGDDRIDRDYLSIAVPIVEKEQAQILFSSFEEVDEEEKVFKKIGIVETNLQSIFKCDNQSELCYLFIKYQFQNGFFGFISNKLFRRDLWENAGSCFPETIKLAEDLDFYVHLYPFVERSVFIDNTSFYYLQTETNYRNNNKIDYLSQLMVQMDIRTWFIKSDEYKRYSNTLDKRVADYIYYSVYYAFENGEDVSSAFNTIIHNSELMSCIHLEVETGFQRLILKAICNGNFKKTMRLLRGRSKVREIYRRIWRNGKNHTV